MTPIEMIAEEFAFLEELGFRHMTEDEDIVRYDRPDGVFVRVFRDPRDSHVGFRIGLSSNPRDALTDAELARLSGVPTTPRRDYPELDDPVYFSIARAAQELRRHGERPLAGDTTIYDEVQKLRRAYTQQFTRDGRIDPSKGR